MDPEQYPPGSVAATGVGGDDNDDDDDIDNIANIEEQPHDNATGSDTDNGDGDNDDVDDDNINNIEEQPRDNDADNENENDNEGNEIDNNGDDDDDDDDDDNDAEADAAVNRLLCELFDRMQNGKLRRDVVAIAGKLGSILLKRKEFPYRQRKIIRTLVTDFFRNLERFELMLADFQEQHPGNGFDTMDEPIKIFLKDLCRDIGHMLCDQSHDEDTYRGLDSNRDTEKEVITAIRFFPETLTHVGGRWGDYPIACVQVLWDEDEYAELVRAFSNTKAVFFVHVLAKLAIEYNSFEEDQRGGLLDYDAHGDDDAPDDTPANSKILNLLVRSQDGGDEAYHRNADTVFLEELMRLYQMDLFRKEDIQRCDLLTETMGSYSGYFEERRFRFLVQLDPYSLMHVSPDSGYLPLYVAATNFYRNLKRFRSVFDAGMRYFPYQNGITLLFRKNHFFRTPFQHACGDKNKRRKEVMDIVEDIVSRYSETTPINTENALILAATDASIHLDCVFFLLKRQPDVLLSLLRQPPQKNTDSAKISSRRSGSTRKSKRKRN